MQPGSGVLVGFSGEIKLKQDKVNQKYASIKKCI